MAGLHVKKGDRVKVIAGKDKGKEGEIIRALPKKGRVVVERVNRVKEARRPTQSSPQGGISTMEAPLDVANVMLICPSCKEPTRVGHRFIEVEGKKPRKVRVCKKCGKDID